MAASSTGDVLFERGQDEETEEDIWDDTALIKAYDEAVSKVKLKVAEQTGFPLTDSHNGPGKTKKKKKKHKKSHRNWSVGDVCRARFTEDNVLYEAEVISVDTDEGTCYVRYTDYGNEEEQALGDLLPVKKKHRKQQQVVPQMTSDIETDSGVEYVSGKSSPAPGQRSRAGTSRARGKGAAHPGPPPVWPGLPPGPGLMPPPMFPPPAGMSSNVPLPPWASSQGLPFPIPPPPPPMSQDEAGNSSSSNENPDPLCSMLLSWYMSGYHTGYFLGLQQGQKQASSPFTNR